MTVYVAVLAVLALGILFGTVSPRDVLSLLPHPSVPGALRKRGVTVALPERPELTRAVEVVHRHSLASGYGPAVVTSGTDGRHLPESLHYKGLAYDFRTREIPEDRRGAFAREVRAQLGKGYDVLNEGPGTGYDRQAAAVHLHVEWDPKQGVT